MERSETLHEKHHPVHPVLKNEQHELQDGSKALHENLVPVPNVMSCHSRVRPFRHSDISACGHFGISVPRFYAEMSICRSLYHACVQSHLDYCSTLWAPASVALKEGLAKLQRKALRAMTGYKGPFKRTLNQELGITSILHRWKQSEAVWLFKIWNKSKFPVPDYLSRLVNFRDMKQHYNLRIGNRVDTKVKKKIGESSFAVRLKQLLEHVQKVNAEILNSETVGFFKFALKVLDFEVLVG
ncbi:uncharacterized protein LOC129593139 [Paramacrobiotus metropolitanus]|uniref:uncharacterized protein LOC129593139 n=1 Tax=Paramacrobiotus metropolitanus TaxID=2943436 RepID=UPI002445E06D|nr:uncharacterized protein LOC129593139 [Paramacrobiotus metropolitanus]